MNDLEEIKNMILNFLAAGGVGILAFEIHALRKSVESLNEKMAVLIERTESHDRRISRIEEKVLQ